MRTESNIRKASVNPAHVNNLIGRIYRSGIVNPIDNTPVNEIPICVTPCSPIDFSLLSEEEIVDLLTEQGVTVNDGSHRKESVPNCRDEAGNKVPGTHLFVSIFNHIQDPLGVCRRINSMKSNDYCVEGLPHEEMDDEKNIYGLIFENYFPKAHELRHPSTESESLETFASAAAEILRKELPQMFANRGLRWVKNRIKKGINKATPDIYAKETNKDNLYESILEGNPHSWETTTLKASEGVKEIVICPNGTRRKVILITGKNSMRKDAIPGAFLSKTNDSNVKIDLFAGYGNQTALSDAEVHRFRMECCKEFIKNIGTQLVANGEVVDIFDNLYFQKQIRGDGKLADPKGKKWLTMEDVYAVDKKAYPEKHKMPLYT